MLEMDSLCFYLERFLFLKSKLKSILNWVRRLDYADTGIRNDSSSCNSYDRFRNWNYTNEWSKKP